MFGRTGAFLLCISNLPPQVSRRDLKNFVRDAAARLRDKSSRASSIVIDCTIVRLTDPVDGRITHAGLVSIQPAKLALSLIDELRRSPLRGTFVEVCRYRHSSTDLAGRVEAKTISDLLRTGGETDTTAKCGPMKVDLVPSTGPVPQPQAKEHAKARANPDRKSTQDSDSANRPADDGSVYAH